ncbi:MAG: hypothetical protein ACRDZ6_05265 [Acidimicrobiales bacterium]
MALAEVTLLTDVTGESEDVPGLGLCFDEKGMTVRRPDGSSAGQVPWVLLRAINAEAVEASDGERSVASSTKVSLEVRSDRRTHHFELPNVQPEALGALLSSLAGRYGRGELAVTAGRGRKAKGR